MLVVMPAVVSGVPDVSLRTITPPNPWLITNAPFVAIAALTLDTLAALMSLASVVNVVPLSITVVADDIAVLLAALALIVNVLVAVNVGAVAVPVTSRVPFA